MYGMVNQALEDLVVERAGAQAWEEVKRKAGVDVELFVRQQGYPDEITYALVGAACEHLGTDATELLRAFGVHWVVHTAAEGYAELMAAGGRTLGEFLANLPDFHTRVGLLFPHLQPPEFRCTDAGPDSVRLQYYSHRPGLTQLVVGLLYGLGQHFGTPVHVEIAASRDQGADHDEFLVRWGDNAVP